jgi:hypothetical protein
MAKKERAYIVMWQPLLVSAGLDTWRVVDEFKSAGTLAEVVNDVERAAAQGEYSWQHGEGIITVCPRPDATYRVLSHEHFSKRFSK